MTRVSVLAFFGALMLPMVGMLFVSHAQLSLPNEVAAPRPYIDKVSDWKTYFPILRTYLEQNYYLRKELVRWHGRGLHALHVSPSDQVVIGHQGWLYFLDEAERRCIRHQAMSEPEVAQFTSVLAGRHGTLSAKGIPYLVMVTPDKHSVYPEHLPRIWTPGRGPSRWAQVVNWMREHYPEIEVVDVLPELLDAKKLGHPLYHREDSHWSMYGAFIGYTELMRHLERHLGTTSPVKLDEVRETLDEREGDLAILMGLHATHEPVIRLEREGGWKTIVSGIDAPKYDYDMRSPQPLIRATNPNAPWGRALVYRDSFAAFLIAPLGEHFREILYVTDAFDTRLVDEFKPDVVVQQMVERWFQNLAAVKT